MAEGRIKDPSGAQAQARWGYIQRINSIDDGGTSQNWPDTLQPKVIPFYNTGGFRFGDHVEFDIICPNVTATISINEKQTEVTAILGIASNVRLYQLPE